MREGRRSPTLRGTSKEVAMVVMDQGFWVAVTYVFTVGVLAIAAYAVVRIFKAGGRHH